MGHSSIYTCPHCRQITKLTSSVVTRISMASIFYGGDSEPLLKSWVSPSIWKEAKQLLDAGWTPKTEMTDEELDAFCDPHLCRDRIYFCPQCHTLESCFDFSLLKGAETYHPQFICNTCGSELIAQTAFSENPPEYFIRCTACGALFREDESAEKIGETFWD